MHTPLGFLTLGFAAVLTVAPALAAQTRVTRQVHQENHGSSSRYTMILHDDDRSVSVALDGRLELNDDDTDVTAAPVPPAVAGPRP